MSTDLSLKTTAASLQPRVELNAAREQGTCVETKYRKNFSAPYWEPCVVRNLDFSPVQEVKGLNCFSLASVEVMLGGKTYLQKI